MPGERLKAYRLHEPPACALCESYLSTFEPFPVVVSRACSTFLDCPLGLVPCLSCEPCRRSTDPRAPFLQVVILLSELVFLYGLDYIHRDTCIDRGFEQIEHTVRRCNDLLAQLLLLPFLWLFGTHVGSQT